MPVAQVRALLALMGVQVLDADPGEPQNGRARILNSAGGLGDVIEYLHDLPGTLGVRSPLFRRSPERATVVQNRLQSVDGVRSVIVNLVTGSVTIHYDRDRASAAMLLETLACHGCSIEVTQPVPRRQARSTAVVLGPSLSSVRPAIGRTVATYLVERRSNDR